jgi:hypothetical protein
MEIINPDIVIGKMCICSGTIFMDIDDGTAVRQVIKTGIHPFKSTPVVTATIFSPESQGTMFCIFDITTVLTAGATEIKVTAANTDTGTPSKYKYFCSYTIIGRIA